MTTLPIYFIEVNLALATFYLFYRLLLHKDTFFKQKRVAFLLTYLFTVIFPFIDLSNWLEQQKPLVVLVQTLDTTLPDVVITPDYSNWSVYDLLLTLYASVVVVLLVRFILQLYTLAQLLRKGNRINHQGIELIQLPAERTPFSFFRWIFIHTDDCPDRDLDEIIQHEKAHCNQHHSWDIVLAELICIFVWINPFAWLIKRRLRENLEYLADREVLKAGFNTLSYQYHLLRMSSQENTVQMANHFNVIHLKQRIIMMNKQKTSLMGLTKYALSMPVFAFLLLAAQAWGIDDLSTTVNNLNNLTQATISVHNSQTPQAVQAPPTTVQMPTPTQPLGTNSNNTSNTTSIGLDATTDKPLTAVENMPIFPGGDAELVNYISKNLRYPVSAQEKGIEGRVTLRFVVQKDGSVNNVEVLRGLDQACDEEAVRVIKAMPKWTPGRNKGVEVAVYYTIPILYKLNKETSPPPPINVTLVQLKDGQPTTTQNVAPNNTLPLVIVDNKIYQIDGLDLTKANENDILKALNQPNAVAESVIVIKGKAAEQMQGERGKNGIIMITTKK